MLHQVKIGTTAGAERLGARPSLAERLEAALAPLAERGIRVDRREEASGELTFIDYRFSANGGGPGSPSELKAVCRQQLARALSEIIVELAETELLRQIVRRHYDYFDPEEQERIVECARSLLARAADGPLGPSVATRKARIYVRLLEHLEERDQVNLDGFIRFRLKDYVEQLEDAVDRAVDEQLMEREYREFIQLLRCFVEVQEPRPEAVHVMIRDDGGYALLDGEGRAIDEHRCTDVVVGSGDRSWESDDLLISALISLAPRRIVIHDPAGCLAPETTETLKRVFERGVHACRGCRLCRPPQ